MTKVSLSRFCYLLVFIFFSSISFSQTFIRYNAWTGSSGCNIFSDPNNSSAVINVPATINGANGTIAHRTAIGQPTYDNSNKTVNLVSEIINGSQSKGTEYRITVNFKQGYSYRITITAMRIMSQQTGANVLLRTDLNNIGSGSNNQCNGTGIIDANSSGNLKKSLQVTNSSFSSADTNYVFEYASLSAPQNYLMVAAIPPTASVYQTILIRRIKIEETGTAELTLSPTSLNLTCGTTTAQTFTVSNPNNVANITSYEWNLGSASNGWLYNGSAAPQNISTTSNSISLTPVCGSALQNVSVTVRVNSLNYKTYTCTVSTTSPGLSINGNADFCSGTSTYAINNLPCNASVSWAATPGGIVSLSCTSCSSTTLTKVAGGIITLTAIVNACGGSSMVTKTITVGTPPPTIIPYSTMCESQVFTLCANPIDNLLSRQWVARVGSSNVTLQETSDWCVEVPVNTLYVDLFVTNACGTVKKRQFILYGNCGYLMSLVASPNPSTGQLRVTALKGTSFTRLRIYDKSGNLKKQLSFPPGTKSAIVNINELAADVYRIQAFDGEKWTTISIIKQ